MGFFKYMEILQKYYKSYENVLKKMLFPYIIQAYLKQKKLGGKHMAMKEKNIWILLVFILSGIVIGGLLGELASKIDFLWWLGYGDSFGLTSPLELDLSVIKITFGLVFKINIASIIGMALALSLIHI